MKVLVTTILAAVVVALSGYLAWTLLPEDTTEPEEEVVQSDVSHAEPVTVHEQETMQEIQRLAARNNKEDIPAFKHHLNDQSPHVRGCKQPCPVI